MTILRHSAQIDHVENLADYPEFLQKLIPEFKPHVLQRYIDKVATIGSVKIDIVMHAVLSALLRGMIYGESLLSPNQTRCFPSIKRIEESSKACESSVRRALRELENAGVITIIETTNPTTGKNNNNIYKINWMAFFDWALTQVDCPEEKAYIVGCMDKLREARRPTRLSVLQGKRGFLTRQKNQACQKLVDAALSCEEGSSYNEPDLTAVKRTSARLLALVKETESANITMPRPLEVTPKKGWEGGGGAPETPSECGIQKGEASTRATLVGSTRATRSTHINLPYISNKITTTSTAGKNSAEEELEPTVSISEETIEELTAAYSASVKRKVSRRERERFTGAMLESGISETEAKANIQLLQEDGVFRATTTSFARMAAKPSQIIWGLRKQRKTLSEAFERGYLLEHPLVRGKFKTEIEAVKVFFPQIYDGLEDCLPESAGTEDKTRFLASLSDAQLHGCLEREEDIRALFTEWLAVPMVETTQKIVAIEETISEAAEEQEEADYVEVEVETAIIPLVSAPVEIARETDHQNTNQINAVFYHLFKQFGSSQQAMIVAFCKSVENFGLYFDGAMLKNRLEFDFTKFLTAQREKAA